MKKKISLIVPTLNQGQFIDQCLHSVLSQNYEKLQLIVIDGGSTDQTVDIIRKYEKFIDYWMSENDAGQSDAINKGLKKVDGQILNWLNSDDYLEPGSLNKINVAFDNPQVNVFSGRSNIIQDGKILRQTCGLDVYEDNLPKSIGMARIDQPETFWRSEVIGKLGPLNTNLHYIMDRDWWIRYLLIYGLNGIVNSDEIIANFRWHNQSKTVAESASFNKERNAYFSQIFTGFGLKNVNEIFASDQTNLKVNVPFDIDAQLIKQSLNYFLFQLASEYYANSDWKNFNEIYKNIDRTLLHGDDINFLTKLKYRTTYMPAKVHQIIKKLK